jgi:hypothetical protein
MRIFFFYLVTLLNSVLAVTSLEDIDKRIDFVKSKYGIIDEMDEAFKMATELHDSLGNGSERERVSALSKVIHPVTKRIAQVTGRDFVKSMSVEALYLYSDAAAYWVS